MVPAAVPVTRAPITPRLPAAMPLEVKRYTIGQIESYVQNVIKNADIILKDHATFAQVGLDYANPTAWWQRHKGKDIGTLQTSITLHEMNAANTPSFVSRWLEKSRRQTALGQMNALEEITDFFRVI